jgi:hypothetical protein
MIAWIKRLLGIEEYKINIPVIAPGETIRIPVDVIEAARNGAEVNHLGKDENGYDRFLVSGVECKKVKP